MGKVRVIEIHENVFAKNDQKALETRKELALKDILFINVMSSPGSGKTTALSSLINRMKGEYKIGEMDVDINTDIDARKVSDATGIETLQINNGGLCHIDADMTSRALEEYEKSGKLKDFDIIFLENIGNLVCPAEFDTGAHKNMMILSVPEGDDKPLKYPLMFSICDLVLISKIDTLSFFDFDIQKAKENILRLNPKAKIIPVSAKTGEGMDEWQSWIEDCKKNLK